MRFKHFVEANIVYSCERSIKRASQWFSECINSHRNCSRYSEPQATHNKPKRLLDLTPLWHGSKSGIKVIETQDGNTYRYACLSHRWDHAVAQKQTTLNNLQDRLVFLDLALLPKNIRDGVLLARRLDIEYIWVDSICIIQEGDNDADKNSEIAKMGSIYSNAIITIAAVAAKTSSDGCFVKDKWSDICLVVTDSKNKEYLIGARVLDMKGIADSPASFEEAYPLLKRGWVLQERLLSPRLLQCNYGEFTFECLEASHCECRSISIIPHPGAGSQRFDKVNFTWRKRLFVQSQGARDARRDMAMTYWKCVVRTYMQLRLKETSDALPAIAGLAQYLSRYVESDYVAGLWKEFLPTEMLWFAMPVVYKLSPKPRPKDTTAPSWSWTSVAMGPAIEYINCNRTVAFPTSENFLEVALKEIYCESESPLNSFGRVRLAYLRIDMILYPWYIRRFCYKHGHTRYRNRMDLYTHRPNPNVQCHTSIAGLPIHGGVELNFDAKQTNEGTEFEPFDYCVDGLKPCALAPVFLLHALHREGPVSSIDVFLILLRTTPQHGKPNCYKRIGLMKLEMNGAEKRSWEATINGQISMVREEFWLFLMRVAELVLTMYRTWFTQATHSSFRTVDGDPDMLCKVLTVGDHP